MVLYTGDAPGPSSAGEAAGAQKFLSGTTTSGTASGNSVFMGTLYQGAGGSPHGGSGSVAPDRGTANVMGKKQAYDTFNSFSGKQLKDFIAAAQIGGQLNDGAGFMEAQSLWKKLVDAAAGLHSAGRNVTPMDVLAGYLGKGPLATGQPGSNVWQTQFRGGRKFLVNTQTGEVKYQGPQFETTYNKSLDITDPTTAKAITTSIFQQLLHRDPGNGEMSGFADALRAAEQQSPTTTTTTTEYDMNTGEPIGQTNMSSGGLSADAKQYLLANKAKKSKEYGVVQAATTYRNALEDAIFNNPYGSL